MGVANVPAASAAGLQPKYQKFTSSGTFTLPTGYGVSKPLLVNVLVIGGGGGGSGYTNDSVSFNTTTNINAVNYFGVSGENTTYTQTQTPKSGGSGGIASTQMYLTSNLTITVGAAGTRTTNTIPTLGNFTSGTDNSNMTANNGQPTWWGNQNSTDAANYGPKNAPGGTGGTSTAGSVSATGGAGGTATFNSWTVRTNQYRSDGPPLWNTATPTVAVGAGGTPAGTAGDATPLLGTIAGGSSNATSVKGSFGIGGVLGDAGTSTGVEGTGGGGKAVGASGAVILTWWE